MTTYFVDTSAMVKRYVNEPGSAWVLSWIEQVTGNVIVVSELTIVEVVSALARRRRDKTLDADVVISVQNDFLAHMEDEYVVVVLESKIVTKARQLVVQYPLRTLDAVQLACAIDSTTLFDEPVIFICADLNLIRAAAAEGFATDNPNLHP